MGKHTDHVDRKVSKYVRKVTREIQSKVTREIQSKPCIGMVHEQIHHEVTTIRDPKTRLFPRSVSKLPPCVRHFFLSPT